MQPDENPYVGPRPFEIDDAALFFGRDREIGELVALIVSNRVVLLYAASGAGKSSLLNAAVVGRLEREQQFEVLPVARVRGLREKELQSERNVFVASVLSHLAVVDSHAASLRVYLRDREHGETSDGFPAPRAIVIDQLEELFTAYPERWGDRPGFFEDLGAALRDDPLLRVVLSIREDFLAQLDPYARLLPDGFRARYRLERLGPHAAVHAAKEPARRAGRPFSEGVAEQLVGDLRKVRLDTEHGPKEVVGEYVEPVQLQVACRSLWQALPEATTTITEDHRARFGNVDEVLGQFYDEAIAAAASAAHMGEDSLRVRFAAQFITPMGTRGTVFWTRDETGGIPAAAIEELDARHLIRAELRAGARWYELTHDRLIEPIRASNRSREARRRERRRRRGMVGAALVGVAAATAVAAIVTNSSSSRTHPRATAAIVKAANLERELARQRAIVVNVPGRVGAINSLTYGRGGRTVLAVGRGGVREWNPEGGSGSGAAAPAAATSSGRPVAAVRRGAAALVAFPRGRLVLTRGAVEETLVKRGPPIASLALSRDARYAAAATPEGVTVYATSGRRSVTHEVPHESRSKKPSDSVTFSTPAFGQDVAHVFFAASDGTIRRASTTTKEVETVVKLSDRKLSGIAITEDGTMIAAYGDDPTIALLDRKGVEVGNVVGGQVVAAAFSPSGDRLVTGHRDRSVRVSRTLPDLELDGVRASRVGGAVIVRARVRNIGISNSGATYVPGAAGPGRRGDRIPALEPGAFTHLRLRFRPAPGIPITLRVVPPRTREQSDTNNLQYVAAPGDVRARIVVGALTGAQHGSEIRYAFDPREIMQGIRDRVRPPDVPATANTSGFATWCYWQAGAPDPNGRGYQIADSHFLRQHGRRTKTALPGDLVLYRFLSSNPIFARSRTTAVYIGDGKVVTLSRTVTVRPFRRPGLEPEIRTYPLSSTGSRKETS